MHYRHLTTGEPPPSYYLCPPLRPPCSSSSLFAPIQPHTGTISATTSLPSCRTSNSHRPSSVPKWVHSHLYFPWFHSTTQHHTRSPNHCRDPSPSNFPTLGKCGFSFSVAFDLVSLNIQWGSRLCSSVVHHRSIESRSCWVFVDTVVIVGIWVIFDYCWICVEVIWVINNASYKSHR